MSKVVFLEDVESYREEGHHRVMVNDHIADMYVNKDNITIELNSAVVGLDEDGDPHKIKVTAKGTAKLLPGDNFKLKLGIRIAYAKALKSLSIAVAEFYKLTILKNIANEYNDLINTIRSQGETHMDFMQEIKISMPMKGKSRVNNKVNKEVAIDGNN